MAAERTDVAQWLHNRSREAGIDDAVNLVAAAVALEQIPVIVAERDSRLTKEAVAEWLRSDRVGETVVGYFDENADYLTNVGYITRALRVLAAEVLDGATFRDDQPSKGGDGS